MSLCCSFWTWHAGVQRTGDGHAFDDGGPVSERCRVCSSRLTRTLHLPADALPVCQLTGTVSLTSHVFCQPLIVHTC